uniref:Putative TATA-box bind protein n=1 Tax=Chionoecetes opilio bacilliform virus TaxID=1825681 RepID=A0A1Q3DL76_9VIRU|nr:putative TATA-box bind protein [Chionoecetes opilio bacilliform virus]
MRDGGNPDFDINDWLRVKTALTFTVGKNTVLGECGPDDVSVISKLLFGLFHYFMHHNIKVSAREARRLLARYGYPSAAMVSTC